MWRYCLMGDINSVTKLLNNQPLVSILIPVYNREDMIEDCIQSALDQTYQNIEIIVVDNRSTDHTWKKCQMLSEKDNRIKIFKNQRNIGPVKNWGKCIELANGEYAKILFSDDLIFPRFIEKCLPFLNYDISFVFSTAKRGRDPENSTIHYCHAKNLKSQVINIPNKDYINDVLLGYGALVSPGAALFRRSDLRKSFMVEIPSPTLTGFNAHGAGPDLLLFLLTAIRYKFVAHIPEPLVFFREHEGSTTVKAYKDNSWSIRACYTQSRIWFAEQFLDKKMVTMLIARAYLLEVIIDKKYEYIFRPAAMARKYINNMSKFSVMKFIISLPKLFLGAVKYWLAVR